jgi:hypothetical protein
MTNQESAKIRIELEAILNTLSLDQLKYVAVRPYVQFNREAAEQIGIRQEEVSRWKNRADVDRAVKLMAMDGVILAKTMRRRALAKAMQVKIEGLDDKTDKRLQQSIATEIIEWEMGKATQPSELKADVTTRNEPDFDGWNATEIKDFIRLVSKAIGESAIDAGGQKPN